MGLKTRWVVHLAALATVVALLAIGLTHQVHAQESVTWDDIESWTYFYADYYGADPVDMLRIADCEDPEHNPYAVGRLGERGPYQMHPRGIWLSSPQHKGGYSIDDVEATVAAAAWTYSRGYGYTTTGWYWCANH